MSSLAFTLQETPESRQETLNPPAYTLVYKAVGEQDDYLVSAYALAATPLVVYRTTSTLYRKDLRIAPDGHGQYTVTVPYGPLDKSSNPTGSSTFSFDTSGATINIKGAKQHIQSSQSGSKNHKGAIGVRGDGDVEGADIIVPALKMTYTFKHPDGVVTESFARSIAAATGRTNSATFRGFTTGELLFIGGSGSDGSDSEADVSYNFIALPNETNYTIGDINGIVKDGHHYAWVEFEDAVDGGGEPIRPPKVVHIERVYDSVNFASVFGWS